MKIDRSHEKNCSTTFVVLEEGETFTPKETKPLVTPCTEKYHTPVCIRANQFSNVMEFFLGLLTIGIFLVFVISLISGELMIGVLIPMIILAVILAVLNWSAILTVFVTGPAEYTDSSPFEEPQQQVSHKSVQHGPKKCPACSGTGRCQYCAGTGKRGWTGRVAMSPNDCMQCLGWGVCQTCHGKGVV
jgi:hypothetical protein